MKKKLVALLLAAAMVTGLVACGGGNATNINCYQSLNNTVGNAYTFTVILKICNFFYIYHCSHSVLIIFLVYSIPR